MLQLWAILKYCTALWLWEPKAHENFIYFYGFAAYCDNLRKEHYKKFRESAVFCGLKCLSSAVKCNKLTNGLTPWNRVLLEKLTSPQLVKKFPAFYGVRTFITAFTTARHLSLFWTKTIQSIPLHPLKYYSLADIRVFQVVSFPQASTHLIMTTQKTMTAVWRGE